MIFYVLERSISYEKIRFKMKVILKSKDYNRMQYFALKA